METLDARMSIIEKNQQIDLLVLAELCLALDRQIGKQVAANIRGSLARNEHVQVGLDTAELDALFSMRVNVYLHALERGGAKG